MFKFLNIGMKPIMGNVCKICVKWWTEFQTEFEEYEGFGNKYVRNQWTSNVTNDYRIGNYSVHI
jgi:hypothetical protein